MFLSLSGQACDAVLELELDKLNDDNGVKNLFSEIRQVVS